MYIILLAAIGVIIGSVIVYVCWKLYHENLDLKFELEAAKNRNVEYEIRLRDAATKQATLTKKNRYLILFIEQEAHENRSQTQRFENRVSNPDAF